MTEPTTAVETTDRQREAQRYIQAAEHFARPLLSERAHPDRGMEDDGKAAALRHVILNVGSALTAALLDVADAVRSTRDDVPT